jgi:predicted nucleic acid-binding Zn ribbon protein
VSRGAFRQPKRLGDALERVRSDAAPATLLAAVQGAWPEIAGEAVSLEAQPVSEREGVVTIACRSSTWAQELDLMAPDLLARLQAAVAPSVGEGGLKRLRFTADAARHGLA